MTQPGPALPPVEHEPSERGAVGPEAPVEAAAHGDVPASRGSWGAAIAALGVTMVLAGIAMLVAPFLLDFVSGGAGANLIVCGGITIFLGCLRMADRRHAAIGLAAMAVGVWLFVSSFFLGELAEEAWSE